MDASDSQKEDHVQVIWRSENWLGVGVFRIRFRISEGNSYGPLNYEAVIDNWAYLWAEMTFGAEELMEAYGGSCSDLDASVDYFDIDLPADFLIVPSGERWSALLQSSRGYLLEFDGFSYMGGQAIL